MRMQEAVGLSLFIPLVCTSKPPKAHLSQWLPACFHSETVVQEPLVTFRCPRSTTPLLTVFPVFLWEASLPVHSLKSNEGIWPFPGDRHVTDTQLITLPFLGSYILYTWCANMGTVGVLSARAMATLHGPAHAHVPTAMVLPTFPLPWFSLVSYWFWLPGLQSSLLAVL